LFNKYNKAAESALRTMSCFAIDSILCVCWVFVGKITPEVTLDEHSNESVKVEVVSRTKKHSWIYFGTYQNRNPEKRYRL